MVELGLTWADLGWSRLDLALVNLTVAGNDSGLGTDGYGAEGRRRLCLMCHGHCRSGNNKICALIPDGQGTALGWLILL